MDAIRNGTNLKLIHIYYQIRSLAKAIGILTDNKKKIYQIYKVAKEYRQTQA